MLRSILSQFSIPGTFVKAGRFGSGLINDTYLCDFTDRGEDRKYILQRINVSVFKEPDRVMENVELVTSHIVSRLRAQGVDNPFAVTPALIHTRNGKAFLRSEADFWRVFHFIESGVVFDRITNPNQAFEVGRGLGRFQALVSDLPPEKLHDTLPGFHHTPDYLKAYDAALGADAQKRAGRAAAEAGFVTQRRTLAPLLTSAMNAQLVPIRVVHNDPKVNNIMMDGTTHEALCMLDLDTVKPGTVLFDFGDCVRSAANPLGEDAGELGAVRMDPHLFESISAGYLREARGFLTKKELELLPVSVKVIAFELGLRFLADYLRGDTYFRTNYPDHNLHRARVQFKLLESIEAAEEHMTALVQKLAHS